MDIKIAHSEFRHTDDIDVKLAFYAIERKLEKFKNVGSIVFVARDNNVGAKIEGISTFKNDIHRCIKTMEENGNVKVIGYRLFKLNN